MALKRYSLKYVLLYLRALKAPSTVTMLWFVIKMNTRHALFGQNAKSQKTPRPGKVPDDPHRKRTTPRNDAKPIPRIIFQTWKTRTHLPPNYEYWSSTFSKLNPSFEHVIWDDADNREFIADEFNWFLPFYNAYPKEIYRADIIRFFFLFKYGGLYVDMDTECLRPLDFERAEHQIIFGWMGEDREFEHGIPNAIMASSPRQLLWLLAIAVAIEKIRNFTDNNAPIALAPEYMTGPVLLKETIEFYWANGREKVEQRAAWVLERIGVPPSTVHAANITVLDPVAWYPIIWNNPIHGLFRRSLLKTRQLMSKDELKRLFPRSDLVTYWTHSW